MVYIYRESNRPFPRIPITQNIRRPRVARSDFQLPGSLLQYRCQSSGFLHQRHQVLRRVSSRPVVVYKKTVGAAIDEVVDFFQAEL